VTIGKFCRRWIKFFFRSVRRRVSKFEFCALSRFVCSLPNHRSRQAFHHTVRHIRPNHIGNNGMQKLTMVGRYFVENVITPFEEYQIDKPTLINMIITS
jgi:hypothetical protein